MTQILVGNTNSKGYGSAASLTISNGDEITLSDGSYYQEDYIDANVYGYVNLSIENLAGWNSTETKEIAVIDGDYVGLSISDFVDVYIEGGSYQYISILQAKRATIDLADATDNLYLYLSPYSNNDHWSNLYSITLGSGDDEVYFSLDGTSDAESTQWTEFDVDLGDGNDTFRCALYAQASSSQQRDVDGGDGFDSLILSASSSADVDFVNFEYVELDDGDTLTLDLETLENNTSSSSGLIVNGKVTLADDISLDSMSITELTDEQQALVNESGYDSEDIVAVNLTIDGSTYTLLMEESDIDYSSFDFPNTHTSSGITYWMAYYGLENFDLWSSYSYESTQWLEFSVTLGSDDDRFVYQLASAANSDIERYVDGGDGTDVIYLVDDVNGVTFTNFETVAINPNETLIIDEETLANNSDELAIIGNAELTTNVDTTYITLETSYRVYSHFHLNIAEYGPYYTTDDYTPTEITLVIGDNSYDLTVDLDYFTYTTDKIIYQLVDTYTTEELGGNMASFNYEFGEDAQNVLFAIEIDDGGEDISQLYSFELDGGEGGDDFDTLIIEEDPTYLDFYNFEYVDYQNGTLVLDQALLADNASADDGLVVNGSVEISDDINGIYVSELTEEQQALVDRADFDSDDISAVTVYIDDSSYTLLMDVDDLNYQLAA